MPTEISGSTETIVHEKTANVTLGYPLKMRYNARKLYLRENNFIYYIVHFSFQCLKLFPALSR